ncbi:MAG: hypothetical protein Salg2KO_07200 [Salibacteraceae bacterium]
MIRSAVFISSGIGNAIFLTPLIKKLGEKGRVTALVTSNYQADQIFKSTSAHRLFDEFIAPKRIGGLVGLLKHAFSPFDTIYIDYFGATRSNLLICHFIAKEIVTNHIPDNLPDRFKSKIRFVSPVPGLHEASQYMRFLEPTFVDDALEPVQFDFLKIKRIEHIPPYITIQPGAGNNATPWKIWPIRLWNELITAITYAYPDLKIKVLGDDHDSAMSKAMTEQNEQIELLIGKTSVDMLPEVLSKSRLHIGGDSGLTHIAGAVGTPTVTIVGGTDPNIFGWDKIDPNKHVLIQNKLDCHPCYRWYLPNRSRVSDPTLCPDFKCIKSITVSDVFNMVQRQLTEHVS